MEAIGTDLARGTSRSSAAIAAVVGVGMAAGLAAWGTFGEAGYSTGDYLVVLAIIGVASLVVFGWVVPRGLRRHAAGPAAIALSVLGLLSVAIFWSGLPPVLAAGGIALGLAGWNARQGSWLCRAAVIIGLFVLVGDVVIYIQDMT
jgi:hypothetical protein